MKFSNAVIKLAILFVFSILLEETQCSDFHTMSFNRTGNAIQSPDAPKSNGNYSHVIKHGNELHLSGWMGQDETGSVVEGGVVAQTVSADIKCILRPILCDYLLTLSRNKLSATLKPAYRPPAHHWTRSFPAASISPI